MFLGEFRNSNKMTQIPYADENRSKFIPLIKDQWVDFDGKIVIILKDINEKGYPAGVS